MSQTFDTAQRRFLAVFLLILVPLAGIVRGQTLGERVGPQLSHLPMNARAAALADASSALIDTYAGSLVNPSALGFLKSSWADYSISWVQKGVTLHHVGLALTFMTAGAGAVTVEYLHGSGLDSLSTPPGKANGSEIRVGVGYGRVVAGGISLGMKLHFLHASVEQTSASAVLGDIGLTYAPGRYITYALTLSGLGSAYRSPRSVIPPDVFDSRFSRVLGVGLVFDFPFSNREHRILFSMGSDKILGERYILYKIGVEYGTISFLRMRVGLKIRGTESEPRAGIGAAFPGWSLDYAYLYSRRDQGPSHLVTLAVPWN